MNWRFLNTGFNTGSFNMDYDLELVRNFLETPVLRIYQWKPYCISLGANQDYNSVDQKKAADNGLDIVSVHGGRAYSI
jgi:lipoate-protein ligase A